MRIRVIRIRHPNDPTPFATSFPNYGYQHVGVEGTLDENGIQFARPSPSQSIIPWYVRGAAQWFGCVLVGTIPVVGPAASTYINPVTGPWVRWARDVIGRVPTIGTHSMDLYENNLANPPSVTGVSPNEQLVLDTGPGFASGGWKPGTSAYPQGGPVATVTPPEIGASPGGGASGTAGGDAGASGEAPGGGGPLPGGGASGTGGASAGGPAGSGDGTASGAGTSTGASPPPGGGEAGAGPWTDSTAGPATPSTPDRGTPGGGPGLPDSGTAGAGTGGPVDAPTSPAASSPPRQVVDPNIITP